MGQIMCKTSGDYITNLPETLLSEILSRLPTIEAVRTSILSKDWAYKWTLVDNVDIHDGQMSHEEVLFVNFMERILGLYPFLRRFSLECRDVYGLISDIERWISTALGHNLESLEVRCNVQGIVLPCSLLSSTSLQKLQLNLCKSILNVAAKNCAPKLTSLSLSSIKIVNGDGNTSSVTTFDFPLLQTFCSRRCKWLNVECMELYTPSLTRFHSAGSSLHKDYDYSFVIHAPRLAKFESAGLTPEKIDVICGSSIVSADLRCDYVGDNPELLKNLGSRIVNMLNGFTNVLELRLSVSPVILPSGLPLQPHDKLKELNLWDDSCAEQLLTLLHVSPSLKLLRINVYDWVDYDYGRIPTVPSCIVCHLEEIVFSGFECETPHYNLAKFLLKNGKQLKKITFVAQPVSQKKQHEVKEYISAFRIVDLAFVKRDACSEPPYY